MKELLEDKNRLKIDVRLVYGKSELQPEEINWLRGLSFIRTSFCKNLHAKSYLNEELCIVTSLNLYDFSLVNNNEMGVLISRTADVELYKDAYDEAQRIIRISEEVRISLEKVERGARTSTSGKEGVPVPGKVSTHRLAKKLGLKTNELLDGLERLGAIEVAAGHKQLTAHGTKLGGEFRSSARFGEYFVWPENIALTEATATH